MIDIVCLKWGDKFGPEYVNRLYAGFKRHTTVHFDFHCFTENATNIVDGVIIHPLPHNNLTGWWNKLYLFSEEIKLSGRLFFVDLDTLITGNVDQIISYDKEFVVLRDFFKAVKDAKATNVGSGLMSFDAHKHSRVWADFIKNPARVIASVKPHGDQAWIQRQVAEKDRTYWQDLFPNQVVSFKVHCRNGLPENARIVCYHGVPSIPDSICKTTETYDGTTTRTFNPAPWVGDHWKDEP